MTRAALVTGAAGGIGSAIVAKLEADGWSVHGVDVADADLTTREGNRAVVDQALHDPRSAPGPEATTLRNLARFYS